MSTTPEIIESGWRTRGAEPSDETLETIDRWWRAANYLSVGQIYLLDNPLLREPLDRDHVKPRLLGHWGTTPGLNFLYAHLNRVIARARAVDDLRHRSRPRRPRPGRQRLPRRHLHRGLLRHHPGRRGPAPAVPPVLVPRRHPQPRRPRDARLDPRGRRARLRAVARLRRGVRQPRPAGRRGRRRRRGRDRPAGHELALQQVRQPGQRRRRPADPAPQRVQDRQPDRPRPDPRGGAHLADGRLRPPPVPRSGGLRRRGARRDAPPLRRHCSTTVLDEIAAIKRARRRAATSCPTHVADDRLRARPRAGRARRRSTASRPRAPGARTRCRWPTRATPRRTVACSRTGCAPTARRSSSTPTAGSAADIAALAPEGHLRMSANPHANGGLLLHDLRLPDFRDYARRRAEPRRDDRARRPKVLGAVADATSSRPTRTTSGSSARTRRRPTASRPSSR